MAKLGLPDGVTYLDDSQQDVVAGHRPARASNSDQVGGAPRWRLVETR